MSRRGTEGARLGDRRRRPQYSLSGRVNVSTRPATRLPPPTQPWGCDVALDRPRSGDDDLVASVIVPVTAASAVTVLATISRISAFCSDGQAVVAKFDGSLNTAVNRHILELLKSLEDDDLPTHVTPRRSSFSGGLGDRIRCLRLSSAFGLERWLCLGRCLLVSTSCASDHGEFGCVRSVAHDL